MTATYPTDATYDLNSFPILSSIEYTNTGVSQTQFELSGAINFPGELLAVVDGVVQDQYSYDIIDGGLNVLFVSPPNAANLVLKSLTVPGAFIKTVTYDTVAEVVFSNSTPVSIDSNTYTVDGVRTSWALPTAAGTDITKDTLLVMINGIVQVSSAYTFPSSTLTTEGIDISPAVADTDTIHIKAFVASYNQTIRCNSMENRKPDKGFNYSREFAVSSFQSVAGYEKTRLMSRKSKRKWTLTYTNITGIHMKAIDNFYISQNGPFETFIFDLSHLSETGTALVKFDGTLNIAQNHVLGINDVDKYYTVSFGLKEVDG